MPERFVIIVFDDVPFNVVVCEKCINAGDDFFTQYKSVPVRLIQYNAAVQLLATFNPTEIGALVRGFREISKTSQRWHVGRLTVFSSWQYVHLPYLKPTLKFEFRILKCRNLRCLVDPNR